jgi:hypothetical protein
LDVEGDLDFGEVKEHKTYLAKLPGRRLPTLGGDMVPPYEQLRVHHCQPPQSEHERELDDDVPRDLEVVFFLRVTLASIYATTEGEHSLVSLAPSSNGTRPAGADTSPVGASAAALPASSSVARPLPNPHPPPAPPL